jgi:transposase-like protein
MRPSRYSSETRRAAVREMNIRAVPAQAIAAKYRVSLSQLYRWRRESAMRGPMDLKKDPTTQLQDPRSVGETARRSQDWSGEDKLAAVIESASLSEAELGGYLRRRGLHRATLEAWRQEALQGLAGAKKPAWAPSSKEDRKRIRGLEKDLARHQRELARKDKALAEAAALLVLKKKVESLWADEEDDTDPRSGR